jgi:hypothetical protein
MMLLQTILLLAFVHTEQSIDVVNFNRGSKPTEE